ncbi:hypothetical protein B0F90DRAFT_1063226 [Multifurca ochricompacta]|uniref:Uncharacterized protein n=1 Tax=Multifurca ochricompacta TaxID=376703 RepID=A0AAD4QN53_9AGAM|nr:hypothetical protein B0F90DRAFT_1063226 [Multifurca ochricompacta]
MSKLQVQQNTSSVASRTAFDLLTVDSGEEEEEEEQEEHEGQEVFRDTPSKPSKTALKKAAKAARQEKKQQSRTPLLSGGDTPEQVSPAPTVSPTHITKSEATSPTSPDQRPVEHPLPLEPSKPLPPRTTVNSASEGVPPPARNGHSIKLDGDEPRPTTSGESFDSPPIAQRERPATAEQPLSPSPPRAYWLNKRLDFPNPP